MANTNLIDVEYNRHKQQKITTSKIQTPLGYTIALETGVESVSMQIRLRLVETDDIGVLVFDLLMISKESWLFLSHGDMSLILDDENFSLECNESHSETDSTYETGVRVRESVYYELDDEILARICSAEKIEMRISGESSYIDITNKGKSLERFQLMCQQFYHCVFDENKYIESTEKKLKPTTSGCFIATAAMGDYDHPAVLDLRVFRDEWLLKREWGVKFTNWYYMHGPTAAKIIEKSTILRKITFYIIVLPLQKLTKHLR